MKVGDKVLCIKNRAEFNTKGNIYYIININENDDTIKISVEDNIWFTNCEYKLIKDKSDVKYFHFNDYFNILKIQRKEKLNKLNIVATP